MKAFNETSTCTVAPKNEIYYPPVTEYLRTFEETIPCVSSRIKRLGRSLIGCAEPEPKKASDSNEVNITSFADRCEQIFAMCYNVRSSASDLEGEVVRAVEEVTADDCIEDGPRSAEDWLRDAYLQLKAAVDILRKLYEINLYSVVNDLELISAKHDTDDSPVSLVVRLGLMAEYMNDCITLVERIDGVINGSATKKDN